MPQPADKRLVTEESVLDFIAAAQAAAVTDADTTHSPTGNAVFDHVASAISTAIAATLSATVTNGDTTHAPTADAVFDHVSAAIATAVSAAIASTVTDGDTTHSPSGNAVFDAITAARVQSVTNGDTTHSPSGDAIYDYIASLIVQTVTNADTTHIPSADAIYDFVQALIVQTVTNGDSTHVPSADAIFDHVASAIATAVAASVIDSIADADTTHAPSRNAVFDALALKAPLASPALTGTPTTPTPAASDSSTKIASTAFVQGEISALGAAIPTGTVVPYAAATAPAGGWLLANGAAVSRTTYAALFALIGIQYGAGDGSTTFNVPNLAGRVPVGYSAAETEFDAIGKIGGNKTVTLTTAQIPTHTHALSGSYRTDVTSAAASGALTSVGGVGPGGGTADTGNTGNNSGGGGAHTNIQPFITLQFIIKT